MLLYQIVAFDHAKLMFTKMEVTTGLQVGEDVDNARKIVGKRSSEWESGIAVELQPECWRTCSQPALSSLSGNTAGLLFIYPDLLVNRKNSILTCQLLSCLFIEYCFPDLEAIFGP